MAGPITCAPEPFEGSLKRLRLDRIDLYQLHRIDPRVPMQESLGALAALQREGKIRHIGVSNFSGGELRRARAMVSIVSGPESPQRDRPAVP